MADTTEAPEQGTTTESPTTTTKGEPPTRSAVTDPPPDRLPDDHPLVKAYSAVKGELAEAKGKVREFEDAALTEEERRQEALAAATRERDAATLEAARLRAAIEHGLSADDLDLIGGSTPEEIAERAKKLAERVTSKGDRRPDRSLGRTEQPVADPDQWLREAVRK